MNYIKIITVLLIGLFSFNSAFAEDIKLSIIDLDSSNSNLLKIFVDKNIEGDSMWITGDIKLFKDLKSSNIVKELEWNKIVDITLINELEKNTSYSLLSVYWADWTIDFKISDLLNWLEILWDWTTGVDKVNIIDSKNLKITFSNDIIWDDIDIKILKEYSLNWLKINDENNKILDVNISDKLDTDSNYLIMLFSFTTVNGINYIISNSIYDFSTSWSLNEATIKNEEIINDEDKTWNIALNSAETPDTWAETWILLLWTFLLSNFIYFRKKISK